MDMQSILDRAEEITGDAAIGEATLVQHEGDDQTIVYEGHKGWYEIADVSDSDMAILFRAGPDWETASKSKEVGIYYTRPLDKDNDAAEFIKQIVDGLPPMAFDCAYIPPTESGVAWIRFKAEDVEILIKMRSSGGESVSEFLVGGLIARMILDDNGEMKSFEQVEESIL